MPPSASLVFLSCSRPLTSPRLRALSPAAQAARSLMAREKQMPPSASLVFLSCSLYREHSSLNSFAVRDEQASPVPAHLRSLYLSLEKKTIPHLDSSSNQESFSSSLIFLRLHTEHFRICSVLPHQFFMAALFRDLSPIEQINPIRHSCR